jgi:hypothetical protein
MEGYCLLQSLLQEILTSVELYSGEKKHSGAQPLESADR